MAAGRRPIRDLDPELRGYRHEAGRKQDRHWRECRKRIEDRKVGKVLMDRLPDERKRVFATETGQVENLRPFGGGTLISEGFEGVGGSCSVTEIGDSTLNGHLEDRRLAPEMAFDHVKEERSLNASATEEWHAPLTRRQEGAAGLDPSRGGRSKSRSEAGSSRFFRTIRGLPTDKCTSAALPNRQGSRWKPSWKCMPGTGTTTFRWKSGPLGCTARLFGYTRSRRGTEER